MKREKNPEQSIFASSFQTFETPGDTMSNGCQERGKPQNVTMSTRSEAGRFKVN